MEHLTYDRENSQQLQFDSARRQLEQAIENVRTASDAQLPAAQQELAEAQIEAERCQGNLEADRMRRGEGLQRFTPTPIDGPAAAASYRSLAPTEKLYRQPERHLDGRDEARPQLGRALRAIALGDWTGAEAEMRVMGGATGSAGGFLIPSELASWTIDLARARSVVIQAGVRTIPIAQGGGDGLTIARLTADPVGAWVEAGGPITPSDPTFGAVQLVGKKFACIVRAQREILRDAPNAADLLELALSKKFAAEIDRVVLEGSGIGAEPAGLASYSTDTGISEVEMGTNGAAPTNDTGPAKLSAAVLAVRQANHEPTAVISSPRSWSLWHDLKDSTKQPLRFGAGLDDLSWLQTSNCSDVLDHGSGIGITGNIYAGDWTRGLLGVIEQFEVYVTRDPYLTTDEVAFLCTWRGDFQVEDASAFARLVGIKAT